MQGFRLSPQQRLLWLTQEGNPAFCAQCVVLLEGRLDAEALRRSAHDVAARHDILRTTFRSLPGAAVPLQVVAEVAAPSWDEADLSDSPGPEQKSRVEALLREEAGRPFDFEAGPLLRLKLAALAEGRHALLVTLPALCADSRTLNNLVEEVAAGYGARAGDPPAWGEPMQYLQFSEWQNELLEEEGAEEGKGYWKGQDLSRLSGQPLPFGHDPGAETGFDPDSRSVVPDREACARLRARAQSRGASFEALLLTCWQTLLWRLTGQPVIVVGCLRGLRDYSPEVERSLGLFSKWLPVSSHFQDGSRFDDLLSNVDRALRQAPEWQEYFTLEDGAGGAAGRQPFFTFGFEYEQAPAELDAGGVRFRIIRHRCHTQRFELRLRCVEAEGGLTAEVGYNARRYAGEEAGRIASHFEAIIRSAGLGHGPEAGRLEILGEAERRRLLYRLNDTTDAYEGTQSLAELFEAQAARTPDAEAAACGGRRLSYGELNERANRIAHHLRGRGCGPGSLVAVCLERGTDWLACVLGVLKAGAAYVPLDPAYPKERMGYVLADTRARVVLTQEGLAAGLPGGVEVVRVDEDRGARARESGRNPGTRAGGQDLAYVIYTSGSTGRPKGVMVQHGSVVNLARGLRRTAYAGQDSPLRVSMNAPLVFDASVKQLVQLLYGHAVHVLPEAVRLDPAALLSYVRRHSLDVLDCTPSQLRPLLDEGLGRGPGPDPKLVLVGGEAVDDALWSRLADTDGITFYNVYGPTECTVDTTACRVREGVPGQTIGRPLPNVRTYVLDAWMQPVPVGVSGHLHVGGAGLARGYLNGAAATARRFIPDSFGGEPGARLYRTGDLAQLLPDGSLKFVGRADRQVKLRGFRVEPGEVEAALCEHARVREAAVVLREDAPGAGGLVAYFVPGGGGAAPEAGELRGHLRERLPEYMVPSSFVPLKAMPLTRNGKVDRDALPPPPAEAQGAGAARYVAPRAGIEQTIADVWRQVLKLERVGVDDNFFDLGGNSLLIVQAHSRLQAALGREMSLLELFKNPTISLLAQALGGGQEKQPSFQKALDRASRRKAGAGRRA
jgi:amino acid adenylation domain-containing protein